MSVNRGSPPGLTQRARATRPSCARDHAAPAPQLRQPRERPRHRVVVAGVRVERLQHLPAGVVEQHDDRIAAERRRRGRSRGRSSGTRRRRRAPAAGGRSTPAGRARREPQTPSSRSMPEPRSRSTGFRPPQTGSRRCPTRAAPPDVLRRTRWHASMSRSHRHRRAVGRARLGARPTPAPAPPAACAGADASAGDSSRPATPALERRVLVAVMADEHLARHADDQVALGQALRRHAEAGVADQLAEQQHAVGVLDDVAQRRRRHHAEVGAGELRVPGREHAAAEKRRRHRHAQPLGEPHHLIAQLEAVHLDADDEHRPLRRADSRSVISATASATAPASVVSSSAASGGGASIAASTMSRGISR